MTEPLKLPSSTTVREAVVIFDMLCTAQARLSMFGKDTVLLVKEQFENETPEPGTSGILKMLDEIAKSYEDD